MPTPLTPTIKITVGWAPMRVRTPSSFSMAAICFFRKGSTSSVPLISRFLAAWRTSSMSFSVVFTPTSAVSKIISSSSRKSSSTLADIPTSSVIRAVKFCLVLDRPDFSFSKKPMELLPFSLICNSHLKPILLCKICRCMHTVFPSSSQDFPIPILPPACLSCVQTGSLIRRIPPW